MALDATADNIRVQMKEKGGTPESIFVIWYDNLEDWKSMPRFENGASKVNYDMLRQK